MKNKRAVLSVLGLLLAVSVMSYAASGVRGAKPSQAIAGTSGIVHISSTAVVVYSVMITTGATNDFLVLFDTANVTGIASSSIATGSGFKMRLFATGLSTGTVNYVFDPPLQFGNGLVAANSTANIESLITYEKGRITQGY